MNTIIIDRLHKNQQFSVSENEKKTFVLFLTDGNDQEGEIKISITGTHASVQILGIIIGSARQNIRLFTLQDHVQKESVSDLLIKSVLFDESRFYYRGLIRIEKNAQKSNAYQKNQNLLLSPKAWADSRPELEILANDVRCTHGATVGQLSEGEIYYLMTRGIPRLDCMRMILEGFFTGVIERIPDEKVRKTLTSSVQKTLKNRVL